jgi:hypothetical protein
MARIVVAARAGSVRVGNTVPVNYGVRLSGPVTSLTARRVRHGVSELAHLPVRGSATYKGAFVPRRFFDTSLDPFSLLFSRCRGRSA